MAGTACANVVCDWTYTLDNLDRGDNISYYATARDTSTVGGTNGNSANVNTTSTYSFEVADPNLMFVVEWHDMSPSSSSTCTFQAVLYDTTNEIEFKYSDSVLGGCLEEIQIHTTTKVFLDIKTRLANTVTRCVTQERGIAPILIKPISELTRGANGAHGWETFDRGLVELEDYESHLESSGSSGTSGYYCTHPSFWNSTKTTVTSTLTCQTTLLQLLRY